MHSIKKFCIDCKHYRVIPYIIDIFPYDIKKCTKFLNTTFHQEGLSPEKTTFYHTTFIARNNDNYCGSEAKYFSSKDNINV